MSNLVQRIRFVVLGFSGQYRLIVEMVTPEVVQMLQDNGLAVFVSTVDDPEDMARMKRLGVDGIIFSFPERI